MAKRLTTEQIRQTIEAVVDAPTLTEAARRLGITRNGLYHRMQDPRVAEALNEYYTRLRQELTYGFLQRTERYLQIVDELLDKGSEQAKLRLVLGVLQYLMKLPDMQKRELDGELIDDFEASSRN